MTGNASAPAPRTSWVMLAAISKRSLMPGPKPGLFSRTQAPWHCQISQAWCEEQRVELPATRILSIKPGYFDTSYFYSI